MSHITLCLIFICFHSLGTCVNNLGSFGCRCMPGWSGNTCGENTNECASTPCQNNATCVDQLNKFVCNCGDNGFTGEYQINGVDVL